MNKNKLSQLKYYRLELYPPLKDELSGKNLEWDWTMEEANAEAVQIAQLERGLVYHLGLDHIHCYFSNPERDVDGLKHGTLQLNVQLTFNRNELQWKIRYIPIIR